MFTVDRIFLDFSGERRGAFGKISRQTSRHVCKQTYKVKDHNINIIRTTPIRVIYTYINTINLYIRVYFFDEKLANGKSVIQYLHKCEC